MGRRLIVGLLVFMAALVLAFTGAMFALHLTVTAWRRIPTSSIADAQALVATFIAFGLPVAIAMFAASFTDRTSEGRPVVSLLRRRRNCVVSAAVTSVGGIVVTPFGGWVATIVYFVYFVAVAFLFVTLSVLARAAPFSRRASAVISAAVVASAVVLGTCFSTLVELAASIAR